MAEAFQYKTSAGAAWADVPVGAWPETDGALFVDHPKAEALDGLGRPCGAYGRPRIVIRSPHMTQTGITFWQGLFASPSDEHVTIWLKAYDPRSGSWSPWSGVLHRPTFDDLAPGAGASNTLYNDVEIIVTECEAA